VPDGVRVDWLGLHEESLEVVYRRPHLTLATVHGSHDAPHARADCLSIVAIIIVSHSHASLRTLLVPLLAALGALLGAVDGNIRWCLLSATWGLLPAAWERAKFGHLIASGILDGNVVHLLSGVPKNVTTFTLARVPCAAFGSHACVPLASLSVSLGFDMMTLLPPQGPG
jgi:hypothetical protein